VFIYIFLLLLDSNVSLFILQSLLKHSEKREQLEKVARAKLQAVIVNLSDANKVRYINPLPFFDYTLNGIGKPPTGSCRTT